MGVNFLVSVPAVCCFMGVIFFISLATVCCFMGVIFFISVATLCCFIGVIFFIAVATVCCFMGVIFFISVATACCLAAVIFAQQQSSQCEQQFQSSLYACLQNQSLDVKNFLWFVTNMTGGQAPTDQAAFKKDVCSWVLAFNYLSQS